VSAAPASPEIPADFRPYPAVSAFMALLGPLYAREEANGLLTIGLHLREVHMNHQEAAHGGFLATLADNALGVNAAGQLGQRVATANLSVDYLARVAVGEWMQVDTRIDKLGRRLVFSECVGRVSERMIFKASGVMAVLPDRQANEGARAC